MADEIVARSESNYTPAPEGQYRSVCVDVIDLGMIENKTYGNVQHKVAIVFQIDELDDHGKRHEVAERFTVSMHEKARLRQFLGQWRGKSYTEDEARKGTPLHKLEGQNAVVQIEHRQGANGKTFANISSIMRPAKGLGAMEPSGYVRSEYWKKFAKPAEPEPTEEFDDFAAVGGGDEEPPF
jgi:hypothetical protein